METPQQHGGSAAAQSDTRMPPQGPANGRVWARAGKALAFFVLGAVLGGLVVHLALERPALESAQARMQVYEQDLAAMRYRLEQANLASAALEGRLLVEESTRRGLETGLQVMQNELGQARDSLAFFEQLMPPGPNGSLSVRALDIERLGPHLRYRALLMRSGASGKVFQGSLQFLAHGRQGDEPLTVALSAAVLEADVLADTPETDILSVEFSDFQRSSGLLSLPPGFEPESVTLNVLEGRTVRASHSVALPPPLP